MRWQIPNMAVHTIENIVVTLTIGCGGEERVVRRVTLGFLTRVNTTGIVKKKKQKVMQYKAMAPLVTTQDWMSLNSLFTESGEAEGGEWEPPRTPGSEEQNEDWTCGDPACGICKEEFDYFL